MCARDVITLAPLEYEMIIVALSFLFYYLADMARSSLLHLDRRYMVRIGGGGSTVFMMYIHGRYCVDTCHKSLKGQFVQYMGTRLHDLILSFVSWLWLLGAPCIEMFFLCTRTSSTTDATFKHFGSCKCTFPLFVAVYQVGGVTTNKYCRCSSLDRG